MSGARGDILARLRASLDAGGTAEARRAAMDARLAAPPRASAPGRVRNVDLVEAFRARAEEIGATTARVATLADLGASVADYLRARNLPHAVKASPELASWLMDWPAALEVTHGGALAEDRVGIAAARAGVAETGTVVLASGRASPTKLNFLPETHIVVVPARRIVGTYEEAWNQLRGAAKNALLPRAVNWITGPSRTADIEQTILVGVHGPRRLHIVVLDEDP